MFVKKYAWSHKRKGNSHISAEDKLLKTIVALTHELFLQLCWRVIGSKSWYSGFTAHMGTKADVLGLNLELYTLLKSHSRVREK